MPNDNDSNLQPAYVGVEGEEIADGLVIADLDDKDDRKLSNQCMWRP